MVPDEPLFDMDEIMETCTAMEKANCDMFLFVIGSWMYTSLVTTAVNSLGGKPCVMYGLCDEIANGSLGVSVQLRYVMEEMKLPFVYMYGRIDDAERARGHQEGAARRMDQKRHGGQEHRAHRRQVHDDVPDAGERVQLEKGVRHRFPPVRPRRNLQGAGEHRRGGGRAGSRGSSSTTAPRSTGSWRTAKRSTRTPSSPRCACILPISVSRNSTTWTCSPPSACPSW